MLNALLTAGRIAAAVVMILLAAVIFILLLLFLIPVRYKIHFKKEADRQADLMARAGWLFGALRLDFCHAEGESAAEFHILTFQVWPRSGSERSEPESSGSESIGPESSGSEWSEPGSAAPDPIRPKSSDTKSSGPVLSESKQPGFDRPDPVHIPEMGKRPETHPEGAGQEKGTFIQTGKDDSRQERLPRGEETGKENGGETLKRTDKGADEGAVIGPDVDPEDENKASFRQVRELIRFMKREETRKAAGLIAKLTGKLLRHIAPSDLDGAVRFGMEDPCHTGYILAALGVTIPFHRNRVRTEADFAADRNWLSGEVNAAGRLNVGWLICLFLRGILDRNVREAIRAARER